MLIWSINRDLTWSFSNLVTRKTSSTADSPFSPLFLPDQKVCYIFYIIPPRPNICLIFLNVISPKHFFTFFLWDQNFLHTSSLTKSLSNSCWSILDPLSRWRGLLARRNKKTKTAEEKIDTKHQMAAFLEEIKVYVDCKIHVAKKLPKSDENVTICLSVSVETHH